MKYFIGIDNSKLTHSVSIIDENGNSLKTFEIENNHSGFELLREKLKEYTDCLIAFESAKGPLIDYLRKFYGKIYSLNPLKVNRFKESYCVSKNKTDKIDSITIAQFIRMHETNCREMIFNSKEVEILKSLCVSHDRLTKEHTRYTLRLLSICGQYFPLYENLFSHVSYKINLKMIQKYPTWSVLKSETEENLKKFFISNKYCNNEYIKKVLEKIKNYNHCIEPEIELALSLEAIAIANMLLVLKTQLDLLEKQMAKITEEHSLGKVFQSLPGAGNLLASKLFGLMGDNKDRFENANQAQCLFGTAPMNYQSGNYHRVRMRKACNKRGKNVLYTFSFASLRFSKWARDYYDKQRKGGKKHSVALRALSNKWLKIIFTMWFNNAIYDPEYNLQKVA